MKGMILKGQEPIEEKPLKLQEFDEPSLGPKEVLIKTAACGVCHTDLHIVEGELPIKTSPIIPGHEIIGEVIKTGKEVKKIKAKDRVGIPWLYSTCGNCSFCKSGLENLCENARFTGWHVNGGYAETVIGLEDFVYGIPDEFDDLHAAPLMCAGVVGYRAYKMSEIQKGGKLGLFGFGASAHVIIQIAAYNGCEVFVFTRSKEHKKHAKDLGAVWTGGPDERPKEKLDSCIIFAPAGKIVLAALEVVKKGGVVANSSIYMDNIPAMDYKKHLYWEKKLVSVANSTREDVTECLQECARAKVKTDIEQFHFEKANEALLKLKQSKIKGGAVLTFEG